MSHLKPRAPIQRLQNLTTRILTLSDPVAVLQLDELERDLPTRGFAGVAQSLRRYSDPAWWSIVPEQVHPGIPQAALRCLTAHRNGHVREAAVRCLDDEPGGVRWLILSSNDWYQPIADLAQAKLVQRVCERTASFWLPYLDLIRGFERNPTEAIEQAFDEICRQNPLVFEIFIAEPAALPASRRLAWEILHRLHPSRALDVASASGDVVLRLRAVRSTSCLERWRLYLNDPAAILRRQSLSKLHSVEELDDGTLAEALLDRVASVRDLAKFLAKKSGRSSLLRPTYARAPICVGKLEGSVGILPDDDLKPVLLQSLVHPTVSIQKAAMQALDRILPEAEELWWDMLGTDPSPSRRRTAGILLCRRRSFYVMGDPLWQRLEQTASPIKDELQALAERSPNPFTRLKAHYHSVLLNRQRWSRDDFHNRLREISRELPPYNLSPARRAEIEQIVSHYGDEQKRRLGI